MCDLDGEVTLICAIGWLGHVAPGVRPKLLSVTDLVGCTSNDIFPMQLLLLPHMARFRHQWPCVPNERQAIKELNDASKMVFKDAHPPSNPDYR